MPTTSVSELSSNQVFDPEVYGNGDPATFGLPLDLYERMRTEEPLTKVTMDHPMLIDEVWVISRYQDIYEMDRDQETWASGESWTFGLQNSQPRASPARG